MGDGAVEDGDRASGKVQEAMREYNTHVRSWDELRIVLAIILEILRDLESRVSALEGP